MLRHSAAMAILHAKGNIRKTSLWLGYAEIGTAQAFIRASLPEKLDILDANMPPSIRLGNFTEVRDSLMEFLGGK